MVDSDLCRWYWLLLVVMSYFVCLVPVMESLRSRWYWVLLSQFSEKKECPLSTLPGALFDNEIVPGENTDEGAT